jgi:hypothetical protein
VLHVDGNAGRPQDPFAQALGRALDYPHTIYHDFSATEEVAPPMPVVLEDGTISAPRRRLPLRAAMTEACAYSEAARPC